MKQRTNQILHEYWNEVRGGRPAPHRFEIEPSRICQILPETFILERVDHQTYRFRLAGTKLCEQFGREFRGVNFLELWSDSDRLTLERQFAAVCNDAAISVLTFKVSSIGHDSSMGPETATFEAAIFPLLHGRGKVSRFLGAMTPNDGDSQLGPNRLTTQSLIAHEIMWPDGRPAKMPRDVLAPLPIHNHDARLVRDRRRTFRVYEGGLSKHKADP